MKRRAVITGLGVLSAIGQDAASFWSSLVSGTSGVRRISLFDPSALASQVAGELVGFDAKKLLPATMKDARKSLNKMARTIQLGVCAAQQCMAAGGPAKGSIDPFRFGIEFGCVMVATELDDLCYGAHLSSEGTPPAVNMAKWGATGLKNVPPLWMLKYLPNMPACHVSINYDAQGPNNTITATDVASLLALGEAFRLLGRNAADYFLVGGCDSKVNPLAASRFHSFAKLTRSNNDTPALAVKPFDADADGTVLGEGAAVFGFEAEEHATQRGATKLAEITGFASGSDHAKTGDVLATIIRRAMTEAGITAEDVDHVNASADGIPELDAWEASGIAKVFGNTVPVVSYKAHLGNTGAAAGLIELAASVLAFQHGELPGTINHNKPFDGLPILVHTGAPRPVTKSHAVKISRTDRGQLAVVVVSKV